MAPSSRGGADLSAATTVIGVIGDPVAHSLSPTIHNAAFAAMGLDWVSVGFPVPAGRGSDVVSAMRTLSIRGLSVTMPHKEPAAAACDRLDVSAARLGVVNCLHNVAGAVTGYNTDGDGFVDSVHYRFGRDVQGAVVAVLGAGGAARSIVEALGRRGVGAITIINRTAERAVAVAELADCATVGDAGAIAGADIVVNTTSVGMGASPSNASGADMACDPSLVSPDAIAIDIIYHPLVTPWLAALDARGIATANGVDMLVCQAARQLRYFTDRDVPVDAMRAAAANALRPPV